MPAHEPNPQGTPAMYLEVPLLSDTLPVLEGKLTTLAEAVQRGASIAAQTNHVAAASLSSGPCPGGGGGGGGEEERDPTRLAVAGMRPKERYAWNAWVGGTVRLPHIDWETDRMEPPSSTRPLRLAIRRAEALNRLYGTDAAGPGHAVWFARNILPGLPLVKAMARVIGQERNLVGGGSGLSAAQLADLQTLNEVLSVAGRVIAEQGGAVAAAEHQDRPRSDGPGRSQGDAQGYCEGPAAWAASGWEEEEE